MTCSAAWRCFLDVAGISESYGRPPSGETAGCAESVAGVGSGAAVEAAAASRAGSSAAPLGAASRGLGKLVTPAVRRLVKLCARAMRSCASGLWVWSSMMPRGKCGVVSPAGRPSQNPRRRLKNLIPSRRQGTAANRDSPGARRGPSGMLAVGGSRSSSGFRLPTDCPPPFFARLKTLSVSKAPRETSNGPARATRSVVAAKGLKYYERVDPHKAPVHRLLRQAAVICVER